MSGRLLRALPPLLVLRAGECSVAERVGYGSPFALSTAFKRIRGVSGRAGTRRAPRSRAAGYATRTGTRCTALTP